jgi:hypothetical protein
MDLWMSQKKCGSYIGNRSIHLRLEKNNFKLGAVENLPED